MPSHPRPQQRETQDHSQPKRATPLLELPPLFAESVEREEEMEDIADEERSEECRGDVFLHCGMLVKMFSKGGEDEDVEETEEGADVGELDDGYVGGERTRCGWWRESRPWCLLVVCLANNS